MPDNAVETDQTSARDAGHTTSENFWTKVLVIAGLVISVTGFVGDLVGQIAGILPNGSQALRIAGIIGTVTAAIGQIAYTASRTLVKMKLVDAEIAATKAPTKTPTDAAAAVLGGDAPSGEGGA